MASHQNGRVSTGLEPTHENEVERQSALQEPTEEQPLLQPNPIPAWSPPPGFMLIQIGELIYEAYAIERKD
jgi:hypothetical protein